MAFQNFYSSKITNAIGAGDVTITVDNAPTATSGRMVLEARNSTQREIIKYTGVAGNVLTGVVRGQGGTTAKSHVAASLIQQNATAEDLQDLYDAFDTFVSPTADWRDIAATPSYVSGYNVGQGFSDIKLAGIDATSFLSKGMKLQYSRPSAAPTQVMNFVSGSTMSASRATGSLTGGITTLSTTLTLEALIKTPRNFTTNPSGHIICRRNSPLTGGWGLRINGNGGSQGKVEIYAGTGSVFDTVMTAGRIPLSDDWVRVSAAINIAAGTAAIYFDGQLITSTYNNSAATTIGNIGDLAIGKDGSSATEVFDGYVADVRVWNTVRTQTEIRDYMDTPLTGSETGLVGYWKGDGNFNDLTVSANNLTANNGATATTLDHPWQTIEMAEVQSVTYSAPDTIVRVYGRVPNQTLSSPKWSAAAVPFNYPLRLQYPKRYYDPAGWRVTDHGLYKDYTTRLYFTGSVGPNTRIIASFGTPAGGTVEQDRLAVLSCAWEGNYSGHLSASVEAITTTNVTAYMSSMYNGGALGADGFANVTVREKTF